MERRTTAVVGVIAVVLLCMQCVGCGIFSRSEGKLLRAARTGPTPEKRREALLELRGRVRPWMREDLQTVLGYEFDPSTRALAAQMLGELGDPAAVDELRQSVRQDAHWIVRKRALEALSALLGAGADEDLRHVLANESEPRVRVAAVELARSHLPKQAAIALLLDALQDTAPAVRLKAHLLLQELTGRSAPPERQGWQDALGLE